MRNLPSLRIGLRFFTLDYLDLSFRIFPNIPIPPAWNRKCGRGVIIDSPLCEC